MIIEAEGDQKKLYSIIKSLTAVNSEMPLPHHTSIQQLAGDLDSSSLKRLKILGVSSTYLIIHTALYLHPVMAIISPILGSSHRTMLES